MKTAGDRSSLSGSPRPLPVHQARRGISKRPQSSHAMQRRPSKGMRMLSESFNQMELTEGYNQSAKSFRSPTSYIVGPSTDGPKLHDGVFEGKDMCIDVLPPNIISKGPNGSGARSGDIAICAEDGVVGDFQIEADNGPVVNSGARIDDNSGLESGTASAQPLGEYVSTDASVWSGDSGNDPIASVERVQDWSPPLGIMGFSRYPNFFLGTQCTPFYLQGQHGRRINLQLKDFDRLFPQDNRTPKGDGMNIGGNLADATAMNSEALLDQFTPDPTPTKECLLDFGWRTYRIGGDTIPHKHW